MSNQEALDAIAEIENEFAEYGNTINLRHKSQDLTPADTGFSTSNAALNKSTSTVSPDISAFIEDTATEEQQQYNVVGKRVKTFTFYTSTEFNKVDSKIIYKNDEYEIEFIGETVIQNTTILYKVIGAN